MLRLRLLHAQALAEPGFVEPDPRPAMAELARDFPGALREVDQLPLEIIRARIEEIAAAEANPSVVASWMRAQARFHRLARGALAVKSWIGGRAVTADLHDAFTDALRVMPDADAASAWAKDLAAIANPPRGRVMDLVFARLAHELDTDVASARAAVLPSRVHSLRRGRS